MVDHNNDRNNDGEDSKAKALENYLRESKKLKGLLEATCAQLDEISKDCLGQSLPLEEYCNWMNKCGFSPQEIESAIRKTGSRRIEGGTAGLVKYISGIMWRTRESRNGRAEKADRMIPPDDSAPF